MQTEIILKNNKKAVIRLLQEQDRHKLKELFESVNSEKNFHIYPNITRPENAGVLAGKSGDKGKMVIVVAEEPDGQLIGIAAFFIFADYGRLNLLAVRNDWRGVGVGKKLMDHSLVALQKREIRHVGLAVYDDNFHAIALYERLQFHVTHKNIFWLKVKILVLSMAATIGLPATISLLYHMLLKSFTGRKAELVEMERSI